MNILITGHSSGLGLSLAKIFKANNHKVYGISRNFSKIKIDKEIKIDFNKIETLKKKLKFFFDSLPDLDYVFLNAGSLGKIEHAYKINLDEFQSNLNINAISNKLILDLLLVRKKNTKTVISISSGAAISSKDGWLSYCSSKALMKMILEIYAKEYKSIKFISLAPGLIKTKMQNKILKVDSKKFKSIKKFHTNYPKMDLPDEIAYKIFKNLPFLIKEISGNYIDLRDFKINSLDDYKKTILVKEENVIAIDFDKVIHNTNKGFFDGTLYGNPIKGTKTALKKISQKYEIIVFSVRARKDRPKVNNKSGTDLIWLWLKKQKLDRYIKLVTCEKPSAKIYIDDKAIKFLSWKNCTQNLIKDGII